MNTLLTIDNDDPKWVLLDSILKIFGSRRTKQEMAKHGIKPVNKASKASNDLNSDVFLLGCILCK